MSTKQKRIRLNPQRAKLVKAMAAGKSVAEASRIAGYAHPNAAHNALRALKIRFSDVLEKHGLTDDTLVTKYLLPLMKAKQTKFFAHNGIVMDKRDVADNGTRTSALDMAFRLKGSYPKSGDDVRAESNVEVKVIVERIGGPPPSDRVIEVKPKPFGTAESDQSPQIASGDLHPPRDDKGE